MQVLHNIHTQYVALTARSLGYPVALGNSMIACGKPQGSLARHANLGYCGWLHTRACKLARKSDDSGTKTSNELSSRSMCEEDLGYQGY